MYQYDCVLNNLARFSFFYLIYRHFMYSLEFRAPSASSYMWKMKTNTTLRLPSNRKYRFDTCEYSCLFVHCREIEISTFNWNQRVNMSIDFSPTRYFTEYLASTVATQRHQRVYSVHTLFKDLCERAPPSKNTNERFVHCNKTFYQGSAEILTCLQASQGCSIIVSIILT